MSTELLLGRGWGRSKHNCLVSYLLCWRHVSATVGHLQVTKKMYIEENYTEYDHGIGAHSKISPILWSYTVSFSSVYISVTWRWPTVAETCRRQHNKVGYKTVMFWRTAPLPNCLRHNGMRHLQNCCVQTGRVLVYTTAAWRAQYAVGRFTLNGVVGVKRYCGPCTRHEVIWGSGGTTPILLIPGRFIPRGKDTQYPLAGPQNRSGEEKNLLSLMGTEPWLLWHPARSLIIIHGAPAGNRTRNLANHA
jgi:hypothetical protein